MWGVSWWPFRLLEREGVHPLWATALIYSISTVALLAVRPQAWRDFGRQPLLWLLAAAAGLTNVGFNWAVTVGDVVRVVLLFYLMPAWTVLMAWAALGEKPTAAALLRVALALGGVALVLATPQSGWPVPQDLADWLALAGGFSFALTNVLLRRLQDGAAESRVMAMFGGGGLMAAAAALIGLSAGVVALPPAPTAAWMMPALALSCAFLAANVALQYGAARLNANAGALVMLSEVIFASGSAVLLGAAQPTPRTWLGGALIVAAALWAAWPTRDGPAKPALLKT